MKGLCPDCETMHTDDEPCQYVCSRCGQILEHPEEADGCRDWDCPFEINTLTQKRMHVTKRPPR